MSEQPKQRKTVDVPKNVLVECPLVGKKLRPINACQGCEHFKGMLDRFPESKMIAFAKRYMVACRFPFGRALFEVAEETDDGAQR